jgi:hypothetical protein
MKRWFFRQKYRFDIAVGFLSIVNFALLVVATKAKAPIFDSLPVWLIVLLSIAMFWCFGYFMDRVANAAQHTDRESAARSLTWQDHNTQMDRVESKIDKLLKEKA